MILSNKVFNLEMKSSYTPWFLITYSLASLGASKGEKTATIVWEYKVGNNASIANFVCLLKNQIAGPETR